jgi:hypothetical protein
VSAPEDFLPSRRLPRLYLALGLVSLTSALATTAADPAAVSGFFYHPRMLAVVHLVTLGWIGGSILGSLHVVGPLALRMPLPATRGDHAAFVAFAVGVLGMVSHFWIDSPGGMVWSAGLAALALLHACLRVLPRLARAPLAPAAKWPVGLALFNVVLAAGLGVVLGLNKVDPFLPVHHLQAVLAHAHLAALGFGTLMVIGAGYRLLPMMLPAAMTPGGGPLVAAGLVETGLLVLAVSFFWDGSGRAVGALVAASGIAVFLSHVAAMLRNRRPPPPEKPRPDYPVALALAALVNLAVATVLGLVLALHPAFDAASPIALSYGALALVGFLSQMVVAVQQRLLPLAAWLQAYADANHAHLPPSLHTTPGRVLPAVVSGAWALGTPVLAFALAGEHFGLLRSAALLLLLGSVAHALGLVRTLRRLRASA